jgi:hypothetical protein
MDIESAPNDVLLMQSQQIRIEWSHTIHYATAWWMPPMESQDAAGQARSFAENHAEIRMEHCINEWSIE